jgi:hypothetical protein
VALADLLHQRLAALFLQVVGSLRTLTANSPLVNLPGCVAKATTDAITAAIRALALID